MRRTVDKRRRRARCQSLPKGHGPGESRPVSAKLRSVAGFDVPTDASEEKQMGDRAAAMSQLRHFFPRRAAHKSLSNGKR